MRSKSRPGPESRRPTPPPPRLNSPPLGLVETPRGSGVRGSRGGRPGSGVKEYLEEDSGGDRLKVGSVSERLPSREEDGVGVGVSPLEMKGRDGVDDEVSFLSDGRAGRRRFPVSWTISDSLPLCRPLWEGGGFQSSWARVRSVRDRNECLRTHGGPFDWSLGSGPPLLLYRPERPLKGTR